MRRAGPLAALAGGLCLVGAGLGASTSATQEPFAACERRLAAEPAARESAACFFAAAGEDRTGAETRLRRHLSTRPDRPWLHYYLGNVLWSTRDPAAADHYRTAADLLAALGDHAGETDARLNLASYLRILGRPEDASAALDGAVGAARASGDDLLAAKVEVERASQALNEGSDLIAVYRDLRRIERVAFPDGAYALRRDCLRALGRASDLLGRWDRSSHYWGLYRDLVRTQGDRFAEADATYNLARAELATRSHDAVPERAVALFGQALAVAEDSGNLKVAALSHRGLGRLLAGEEARHHLERCVAIAAESQQVWELPVCLSGLAVQMATEDPAAAQQLIDRSLALSLESGSPWPLVYTWYDRMLVQWETRSREAALADSLAALEIIEALRGLQTSESGRVDVGALWSEAYFWLAGRLLDSEPSTDEVAVAFGLAERARARTLLETLATPERAPAGPSPQHRAVLEEIVATHRRLLDPALAGEERRRALTRLDQLETDEAALREAAGGGALGELGESDFIDLRDLEALVAPGQALLAFQVGLWENQFGEFDGGSWLLAITAGGTRVHRLPDRSELDSAVRVFLGLIERRDGAESTAAAALYRRLLGAALAELPAGIDELVLVPDGPLHLLPFGALRQGPNGPPLAASYRLTSVPSATLWSRWRKRPAPPVPAAALVLADPSPARDEVSPSRAEAVSAVPETATVRAGSLARGDGLGRLPHARREGRMIARRLGRGAVLLMGDDASEARLKRGAAEGLPAIHFATHALVDGEQPGRSAVLLAPGAEDEDGLLQPREIVALDLNDRLVVLSACRGAAGSVLQGEGAMSLARAFFQAGSRTVVAALWPLRDDDTQALAGRFYRHLAAGAAIDRALAEAQREMIAAGYPAAAWAGLVVLGDGAWQPFEPRPAEIRIAWPIAGLAALVLLAIAVLAARGRHRRRS